MKLSGKAFGIFVIVLNFLAAIMVPLDFFIVNVPAWLCVIFAALAVTADVFSCLRASRLGKKIALSIFTFFFQEKNITSSKKNTTMVQVATYIPTMMAMFA